MTDNGGEFNSEELREVASVLNTETCTTAAYSPFQNGLCERNHAVVDNMLVKLREQCPKTSDRILLCWANMAKNALQMYHGYSSYQLVFGRNPALPNIMTDGLPALQGTTSSEIFAEHLNALHEARKAFVQSEAHERVRRALRSKVRASEQTYSNGDRVYYKREDSDRWLGPAKVVFQDGKVVFVRHGSVFVRVSPNRLSKCGQEFGQDSRSEGHQTDMDKSKQKMNVDKSHDMLQDIPQELKISEEIDGELPRFPVVPDEVEHPVQNDASKDEECIVLKKDDRILFREVPDGQWIRALVLGRAGKATGQYGMWYNVRDQESGAEKSVNLDKLDSWRHDEIDDKVEDVNLTVVPRSRHEEKECVEANEAELAKLKAFDTYEEVDDEGQSRISCRWVIGK